MLNKYTGGFMNQFDNVSVVKAANVYFDGNVTSRTVLFADGEKKTLGIMMPGEYEFGTGKKELMEILAGKLTVKLPGQIEWIEVGAGESFEVEGNSKFQLVVTELADYCCSYLSE